MILETGFGGIKIKYLEKDSQAAKEIKGLLAELMPIVERWGRLISPTEIIITGDHGALEEATGRYGYPWLRAWTRFDVIYLQSPSTWLERDVKGALSELLTHELTHLAMYQNIGGKDNWADIFLPLWYREGMASVNAKQGYRRLTVEEIRARLEEKPSLKPLAEGDDIFREEKDLAYSTGHRAFEYLIERYGEKWIPRLHSLIKEKGYTFDAAFYEALGITHGEFIKLFEESIIYGRRS
ncbi:MAG: hypothetical protein Kow0090_16480 [Myxococcota bacterium]